MQRAGSAVAGWVSNELRGIAGEVFGTPYLLAIGLQALATGIGGDREVAASGVRDLLGAPFPKYAARTGYSWPGSNRSPIGWLQVDDNLGFAAGWHDNQNIGRSAAQFGWIVRAWTGSDARFGAADLVGLGPYGQAVRLAGTVGFGAIGLGQYLYERIR